MFMNVGGTKVIDGWEKEIIFFGSPSLTKELLEENFSASEMYTKALDEKCCDFFEDTRRSLPADQCEVVELPIFVYDNVFYSWNNALVEIIDEKRKRIFLPDFWDTKDDEKLNPVFEILQKEVVRILEQEGFECVLIGSGRFMRTLAQHGGSLHCVTKVIRRDKVDLPRKAISPDVLCNRSCHRSISKASINEMPLALDKAHALYHTHPQTFSSRVCDH